MFQDCGNPSLCHHKTQNCTRAATAAVGARHSRMRAVTPLVGYIITKNGVCGEEDAAAQVPFVSRTATSEGKLGRHLGQAEALSAVHEHVHVHVHVHHLKPWARCGTVPAAWPSTAWSALELGSVNTVQHTISGTGHIHPCDVALWRR